MPYNGTSFSKLVNIGVIVKHVLPLFYPRKAKNAVTYSVTTFSRILKVVPTGIEPVTQGFSVLCSTN